MPDDYQPTQFEQVLGRDMELVFQAPLGAGISVTLVTEDGSTHELRAMFATREQSRSPALPVHRWSAWLPPCTCPCAMCRRRWGVPSPPGTASSCAAVPTAS